jgi:hypothetical protein
LLIWSNKFREVETKYAKKALSPFRSRSPHKLAVCGVYY